MCALICTLFSCISSDTVVCTCIYSPVEATASQFLRSKRVQIHVQIEIYAKKINKYEYSYCFIYMHFLISFLALVLSQLWILKGHFLCCRSLMMLQGTPYCSGGGGKKEKKKLGLYMHGRQLKETSGAHAIL